MIERKFIAEKFKELLVQEYISDVIGRTKYSHVEIKRTPLGDKIIIYTSRPGLIVGKKGENIKLLTDKLKNDFNMENPQIGVSEIKNPHLDAKTVAEYIVSTLERFGPKRFKSVGYKALQSIMNAGAMGAEISIGGRGVPSSRSRTTKFYAGYLKKCGDVSDSQVDIAQGIANLKSGTVGIKVSILPPNTILPDTINIKEIEKKEIIIEETITEEDSEKEKKESKKEKTVKKEKSEKVEPEKVKKPVKKKVVKKKTVKKKESDDKEEVKKPVEKKEKKSKENKE